jgi:hypothetical protein
MELRNNENAWIKMGRFYRMVPVLKYIPPILIPIGIFSSFAGVFIALNERRPCTCDQQFRDDKLSALGKAGNKIVQNYLNHVDNYKNCEARRIQLLKELERKKGLAEIK